MIEKSLLYERDVKINDFIHVNIPTIEDVMKDEAGYFIALSLFTSTPSDYICLLDSIGVDFTQITNFDLFLFLLKKTKFENGFFNTGLILKELDLSDFEINTYPDSDKKILVNKAGVIIDSGIYQEISNCLMRINNLNKKKIKPANDEAKEFLIQRAYSKLKKKKNKKEGSILEPLIVSLVNAPQFKYDFDSVKKLTIYQFHKSLHQIKKSIKYDGLIYGIYSGAIDVKNINEDDLDLFGRQ